MTKWKSYAVAATLIFFVAVRWLIAILVRASKPSYNIEWVPLLVAAITSSVFLYLGIKYWIQVFKNDKPAN